MGEGKQLLGVLTAAADGALSGIFAVSGVNAGDVVSATSTGAYTSEFGANGLVGPSLSRRLEHVEQARNLF